MLSWSSIKPIFEKHETPGHKHSSTYCIYVQYRLFLVGDELFDYRLKLVHYLQKLGKWYMKKKSHDTKKIELMLKCERDDICMAYLQCALSQRFPSTVKFPCTIYIILWNKTDNFLEMSWMDSFFPLIRIKPIILHPFAFPARAERNVDFPATDGPFTAVTRPGLILLVTHLNRCFVFGS